MTDSAFAACDEPLPERAQQAIALFNAGEYYQQHDLLEALWRDEPRRIRDLYQGILQVGVAYYQAQRGNDRGALKMLRRSQRWLASLPDVCQGVDVGMLRRDAAQVSAALEDRIRRSRAGERLPPFDTALFRPVRRV
ncbi:DUF309 domain-containing protein [Anaerolineae bacterium CFX9]|nr:DUF309 domain-containing protein [Anaerolineae bacterium CFX9]